MTTEVLIFIGIFVVLALTACCFVLLFKTRRSIWFIPGVLIPLAVSIGLVAVSGMAWELPASGKIMLFFIAFPWMIGMPYLIGRWSTNPSK